MAGALAEFAWPHTPGASPTCPVENPRVPALLLLPEPVLPRTPTPVWLLPSTPTPALSASTYMPTSVAFEFRYVRLVHSLMPPMIRAPPLAASAGEAPAPAATAAAPSATAPYRSRSRREDGSAPMCSVR